MNINGSEILMECLLEQEVDTVFGYPGGAVLFIYDALYKYSDKIRHILTSHEQGASHAADGYARSTGKVGVCIATSGPGATNLTTGIATAFMDSIPMVAITGNVPNGLLNRQSFQEVDICAITKPITKANFIVKDVKDLAETIREAFAIANSGRKGPVLIDIPKDVSAAMCDFERLEPKTVEVKAEVSEKSLDELVKLIGSAKRPLIYAGGGVISSGASKELHRLATKAKIPVALSMMGLGAFPADEPLNLGLIGMHGLISSNRASCNCDLLIVLGARFSDRVAGNVEDFAKNATKVHIDIDEKEFSKNVCCDMHIHSDLKLALTALNKRIFETEANKNDEWLNDIKSWKKDDANIPTVAFKKQSEGFVNPYKVIKMVEEIAPNAIVATDVGQHQMWVTQHFAAQKPRKVITSGGLGTMGYGMGAAIGAQAGNPAQRVVLFTSDGSFHMNCNELATLRSYNLPITIIVMNNTVLGMVRQWQKVFYDRRFSQTSPNRATSFTKLAESFGVKAYKLRDDKDIGKVLEKALTKDEPVLIDCKVSPDVNVLPMIPPGKTNSDMIVEVG